MLIATHAHAAPCIDAVGGAMREFVARDEVAGVVTYVADENGVLHLDAAGMTDRGTERPMETDSLFWIASMTKPVTGTAVMMLAEQGRLSIDDPVSKHIPEFSNLKDAAGNPVSVTIRQCLTHTSGLADVTPEESAGMKTLAELVPVVAAKPVVFAPDDKWQYCQSSINTAARVVEVVSGESFDAFLDKHLFGPLGMTDTTFYPDETRFARLVRPHVKRDGKLVPAEFLTLGGKSLLDRGRFPRANGGLFSTAADYGRFARMILRGGELDGRRYLKPESVAAMTSILTGGLETGFTPGNGWGLGWCVVREPQGVTAGLSPGTCGHGGLYGTQAWIDPVKKRVHILMIQRTDLGNPDGSEIRKAFHEAACQP